MDDSISRQAAIEAMEDVDWYHINSNGQLVHGANSKEDEPLYKAEDVYKVLNDVPSAQPEPKTGKWIFESEYYEAQTCRCSECGKKLTTKIGILVPFCPWCGAKMEGEQDV